jgi:hypothetical protein
MKALVHALLELSLAAVIVAVVWADPAPISGWFAWASTDEELLSSAWAGDDEQFDDALRRGASHAARDGCGATPLHYAASSGDAHLVRRLIALGADVDVAIDGRLTPLVNAATNDHAEVIEILLRAGAQPSDEAVEAAAWVRAGRAARVLREWRTNTGADE